MHCQLGGCPNVPILKLGFLRRHGKDRGPLTEDTPELAGAAVERLQRLLHLDAVSHVENRPALDEQPAAVAVLDEPTEVACVEPSEAPKPAAVPTEDDIAIEHRLVVALDKARAEATGRRAAEAEIDQVKATYETRVQTLTRDLDTTSERLQIESALRQASEIELARCKDEYNARVAELEAKVEAIVEPPKPKRARTAAVKTARKKTVKKASKKAPAKKIAQKAKTVKAAKRVKKRTSSRSKPTAK